MSFPHRFAGACAALVLSVFSAPVLADDGGRLVWEELPALPPEAKGGEPKGLGGLFGGSHNGVLILAGGTNFPDAAPWKGGVRTFKNDIHVLEENVSGKPKWVTGIKAKLPKPIAYGASVSTEYGVVCIGGMDSSQCYPDVFLLRWDPDSREVEVVDLPPLPVSLAHSTAALAEDVIYVAGGVQGPFAEGTKAFYALDLEPKEEAPADPADTEDPESDSPKPHEEEKDSDGKSDPADETNGAESEKGTSEPAPIKPEVIEEPDDKKPDDKKPGDPKTAGSGDSDKEKESESEKEEPLDAIIPLEWKELPPWEGNPRAFAASAAQSDGEKICFFLFSGRNPQADGTSQQLVDSHKYDPKANRWIQFPDVALPDEKPRSVVAASASPRGDGSILIFGGDDGTMAKVSSLVVAAANSTSREAYLKLNETILENHPGYSRDILSLHIIDGVWTNVATFPESCPVTTSAVPWGDSIIIPSGEISPGVRSTKIWKGTWKSK